MIFKCKNCGGNVVYDPTSGKMKCPYCDSFNSEEKIEEENLSTCRNCGAELNLKEFTSATKCDHCGTYIISDDRIGLEKKPNLVIPFKIDKDKTTEILKEKLANRTFVPSSFLSSKTLENLQGYYVPFWLYDMFSKVNYDAIGIKVRRWESGDYEYTETSRYKVNRDMEINYNNIPVDASNEMDDSIMDDVEPFNYEDLEDFDPKFLSGFYSEVYNKEATELETRGREKTNMFTNDWLQSTLTKYDRMENVHKDINTVNVKNQCALFPVWIYTYRYGGKNYNYYVNGQTGESIGKVPTSIQKAICYCAITFILVFLLVNSILNLVR